MDPIRGVGAACCGSEGDNVMTAARAAAYIGGATLLVAWLASAAGVQRSAPVPPAGVRSREAVQIEALASDVQSQAARLRTRLAAAPAAAPSDRNPFSFGAADARTVGRSAPAAVVPMAPPDVPAPLPLELVGLAEQMVDGALTRTAMIGAPGEQLFMVAEGQEVAGQYRVSAVGADAVELVDVTTGATRRLGLR